jgi:hypothetical protein
MNVANNEENKEYKLGGVTGKGFMPGQSGNPSGRPKGTMKDYLSRKFQAMSDIEKEQWILDNKISGKEQIEFGEGKPKQDTDITTGGESLNTALVKFLDGN